MTADVAMRKPFSGSKTKVEVGYTGDLSDNIRHGYGTYTYPNTFFRYEGDWENGVKHGFGKLKMRDGSVYEGEFRHGEMSGVGSRYWATSRNTYEGEFRDGELNGKGVMRFGNGELYEGGWQDNMMEGEGLFEANDGKVYNGSFHHHKRHGEGSETDSEGNYYEGGWIKNMKHGHGTTKYVDGSIYEGQWRCNEMNGEGTMVHSSGVTYEGIWVNGRPEVEPSEIVVRTGTDVLEVEANASFDLQIECRNVDSQITLESGRRLKVSGARRYVERVERVKTSTSRTAVSSTSRDPVTEVLKISTPFFDVEPYPLNVLFEFPFDTEEEAPLRVEVKLDDELKDVDDSVVDVGEAKTEAGEDVAQEKLEQDAAQQDKLKREDSVQEAGDADQQDVVDVKDVDDAELTPLPLMTTASGCGTFQNIMFPALDEIFSTSSCFSADGSTDGRVSKEKRKQKNEKRKSGKKEKSESRQEDRVKTCAPGDYVVIVEEVTSPPFLGTLLPTAYLHVKVVKPSTKQHSSRKP